MTVLHRTALVALCGIAALSVPLGADEGWVLDRFDARISLQPTGEFKALEAIDVDFRGQPHHGIYRELRYQMDYDGTRVRSYGITLVGVTSADGSKYRVDTTTIGSTLRFRIGDPDRKISGKATYRVAYNVAGAMNAFADHDELYWNVTGESWPVRILSTTVTVDVPANGITHVLCFEGRQGSTEACDATFTPGEAKFRATRTLEAGEQLTIVTSLRKGVVAEPKPLLSSPRPSGSVPLFDQSPALRGVTLATTIAMVVGIAMLWWRTGRDRRFVAIHHSSPHDPDERVPFFASEPVAVEFEPPDKIRPGQMGLLLDERADTLDVTATIIDLAVRGYLTITEIPKKGWFGSTDWQIDKKKPADGELVDYERIVLDGLFSGASTRRVSSLKDKFYKDLEKAKSALYADAVGRNWFPRNPSSVRALFLVLGVLLMVIGVFTVIGLGARFGAGMLGLPVILGGLLFAISSGTMPRRTAVGRDLMRRSLGFAKYMKTAEVQQQAFAERANIFTSYLPYAIVFRCVDKWARAFKDIDVQAATGGWYVGTTPFNAGTFSSSLGSFSSSVSSTLASTPGGSGSSGFSGGSSGGGGGGGGGGGW
jgi:uncharacterized membrane protein